VFKTSNDSAKFHYYKLALLEIAEFIPQGWWWWPVLCIDCFLLTGCKIRQNAQHLVFPWVTNLFSLEMLCIFSNIKNKLIAFKFWIFDCILTESSNISDFVHFSKVKT